MWISILVFVEYWTFRMKQTQMYVCTLEEFILVEIFWLLYKLEMIWNENYAGIYTNL